MPDRSLSKRLLGLTAAAAAMLGLGGCGTGVWDFMYPENAAGQDQTFYTFDVINWVTVVGFVPVIGVMIWFAIKYRKKSPDQKALSQVSHNTTLEIVWSIPPFILVMLIFYMGLKGFDNLRTIPDGYTIEVEASQFDWKFTHPNGRSYSGSQSMGALEIPAGQDIVLKITSKDTIHSVHIPDFAVKIDAVNGRYNKLWIPAIDYEKHRNPWADKELPTDLETLEEEARKGVQREAIILVNNHHNKRYKIEFYANWEKIIQPAFEAMDEQLKQKVRKAVEEGYSYEDGKNKYSVQGMKSIQSKAVSTLSEDDQKDPAKVAEAKKKALTETVRAYYKYMAMGVGHTLYCTEMCGSGHSQMIRRVIVHKPDWTPPPVSYDSKGEELFMTKGCAGCHFSTSGLYPNFKGNLWGKTETYIEGGQTKSIKLFGTDEKDRSSEQFQAARKYLIESIMKPNKHVVKDFQPVMPANQVSQPEAEIIVDQYLIGDPDLRYEGP
ncbi:MAG: cytochrome c oxidase subunit II transmembrane domain-containing protein [Phycisphaeraceae bacterium]|nr:cytochrome c oxidase subunit II transmembrane domain-containing protein [Phycisphaeraceae bacterium]